MFASIDLANLRFAAPVFLPLLAVPALLLIVWAWQAWRRRRDVLRMRRHRQLPTARASATERLPVLGDLAFWLCLIAALSLVIVALARPVAVASMLRTSGVDLVILQDASASMRVRDVPQDRWRRSMRFLRTFGESLQWQDDRVALAIFATIAAPQIRLTRDPNTFFFFLDHLQDAPPFRLEDDTTWDTNIERGIYWGLRLIDKDAELAGDRDNPKAFVLVSDGQAWSGEVAKSMAIVQERGIPLYVVGVGTTVGGVIPEPNRDPTRAVVSSVLDRSSLAALATAGGGRYFELDRERDRDIANAIIEATRRRAQRGELDESTRDLYWSALLMAAALLALGVLFLRDRASLALQIAAAAAVLVVLARVA
ncbi:MAG TPA: vWA domain-containing protein [Vicinamibacterales bacterium]|nr:vWA domain-containing protein [Vicinamibacterales bacterium]